MITLYSKNDVVVSKYNSVIDINMLLNEHIQYYIDSDGNNVTNTNYNESKADQFLEDLKKQAPHEEKIDINHENYDYCYARCNADDGYESIGEQQDMQYWDAVNSTTTWKDHITAVKEKYPKT
jgi:DNA modification methylase